MKDKIVPMDYAQEIYVKYHWPDEDYDSYGAVIYTNLEDSVAARELGVLDEDVLLYTDSLDKLKISDAFDGIVIDELINFGPMWSIINDEVVEDGAN